MAAACGGDAFSTEEPTPAAVDDHGDTAELGTTIELGKTVPGFLWETPESDWFRFNVDDGVEYVANLESDEIQYSLFSVWSSDGTLIDRKVVSENQIRWVAKASGTNTLHVRSVVTVGAAGTGADTGHYSVTVSEQYDDHGNDREHATELVLGFPEPGVSNFNSDIDMFSFEATEGWIYKISKAGFVVEEFWLDKRQPYTGSQIVSNNYDSVITWVAPSSGKYYYQVLGFLRDEPYTVQISGGPDDHPDYAGDNPTVLTMNGSTPGEIQHIGDADIFQFEAKPDWVYFISTDYSGIRNGVGTARYTPPEKGKLGRRLLWMHEETTSGGSFQSREVSEYEYGPYRQRPSWADSYSGGEDITDQCCPTRPTGFRSSLTITEQGPVGETVSEFRDRSYASEAILFQAFAAGTYYIIVSGYSGNTGTYSVNLHGEPDDHGDTKKEATTITLQQIEPGATPTHSEEIEGSVQIPDGPNQGGYDRDYFAFDLEPDWFYLIETDLESADALQVNDILVTRDPWQADDPQVIELSPKAPERYFVSVSSFSEHNKLAYHSGTYKLKVTAEQDDHDDIAAGATGLKLGVAESGKIQSRMDEDWFSFEAQKGASYDIFAELVTIGRAGITLIGSDGQTHIATKVKLTEADEDPKILDWVAPNSGLYFVSVWNLFESFPELENEVNSNLTGIYSIEVIAERGELLVFEWPGNDCWGIYIGDRLLRTRCGSSEQALEAGTYTVRSENDDGPLFEDFEVTIQKGLRTTVEIAGILDFPWPGHDLWSVYRGNQQVEIKLSSSEVALEAGTYTVRSENDDGPLFEDFEVTIQKGLRTTVTKGGFFRFQSAGWYLWEIYRGSRLVDIKLGDSSQALESGTYSIRPQNIDDEDPDFTPFTITIQTGQTTVR